MLNKGHLSEAIFGLAILQKINKRNARISKNDIASAIGLFERKTDKLITLKKKVSIFSKNRVLINADIKVLHRDFSQIFLEEYDISDTPQLVEKIVRFVNTDKKIKRTVNKILNSDQPVEVFIHVNPDGNIKHDVELVLQQSGQKKVVVSVSLKANSRQLFQFSSQKYKTLKDGFEKIFHIRIPKYIETRFLETIEDDRFDNIKAYDDLYKSISSLICDSIGQDPGMFKVALSKGVQKRTLGTVNSKAIFLKLGRGSSDPFVMKFDMLLSELGKYHLDCHYKMNNKQPTIVIHKKGKLSDVLLSIRYKPQRLGTDKHLIEFGSWMKELIGIGT